VSDSRRTAKARSPDFLALHHVLQRGTEGILADNADHDGIVGMREGTRRPLHELGKVVEKGGLHLVLIESVTLCAKLKSACRENDQTKPEIHVGCAEYAQKRSVIFPKMLR
jgi:hypothetical protein